MTVYLSAQSADTLAHVQKQSERNMMLNAESATEPREINIGLPENSGGAVVYVDGLKHGHGMPRGQYHWSGGNAYERNGSIGLMEAVITTGEIGVLMDSRTRMGGERQMGIFTLGSSTNGLIRFDGVLCGALNKDKGLYYSLGAYINNDPTNVNAPNRKFIDQKQIYHFALTKKWDRTTLDAIYRFSLCNDSIDGSYSKAPFVYNGDGSISLFNGFKIGRDCYFPEDDAVTYMDVLTGNLKYGSLSNMDSRYLHDVSVKAFHNHVSGWKLGANLHVLYLQPTRSVVSSLAGIDNVGADGGFTYTDGSSYEGYVQNRLGLVYNQMEFDVDMKLSAERRFNRQHKLTMGFEVVFSRQKNNSSTFNFAHTVSADPVRLYKDGQPTWRFNRNSVYMDAYRYLMPFYALYDYTPSKRLLLRTGLRFRPLYQIVSTAAKFEGDTKNGRVEGFNIADQKLCEIHKLNLPSFDYAVSEHVNFRIVDRLFLMAEGFYSMTAKSANYYRNATIPSTAPIGNALGRAGLTYDNKWMDVTALVSYITSWNNATVLTVTQQLQNGQSESIPWTAQYGIGTLGATLDANVRLAGFKLHLLGTWQDPRYRNYNNEFKFSDGSTTVIDYTGKYVTGISQWMFEIDPSYSWDKVRLWASARYYSRQYVSRTNMAYFAGHWETFAGIDWKIIDSLKLSVNCVNLLNQNGAKGSISAADTITDASILEGYVMAGSYIRPFSADVMLTYRF